MNGAFCTVVIKLHPYLVGSICCYFFLVLTYHSTLTSQDIKPNNIFVDCDLVDGTIKVERAQIGDLEMGSMIPPGLNVRGARLGNPMWRSPESHAAARINTPSDVFSFGLVVSDRSNLPSL